MFSLHPGVVSTNLAGHLEARSLMVRLGLPILKLLTFKDPVQGAQTTIHCAVANIEEDSGKYFRYEPHLSAVCYLQCSDL